MTAKIYRLTDLLKHGLAAAPSSAAPEPTEVAAISTAARRHAHNAKIRFSRYFVTDGTVKARCHYHASAAHHAGPRLGVIRAHVTVYAKGFEDGDKLGQLFPGHYVNNTEMQSDYFDKGHVTLFDDHPLYVKALEIATAKHEPRKAKPLDVTAEIVEDETIPNAYTTGRYLTIQVGTAKVHVSVVTPNDVAKARHGYINVAVDNAMHRVYRGMGKSFHNFEAALKAYRDQKVLAAITAAQQHVNREA